MNVPLVIQVDQLREGPIEVEVNSSPEAFDLADAEYQFVGPVTGKLTFEEVSNDVLARGKMHACVQAPCGRCLEPAVTEIDIDVNEIWLREEPDAPEALDADDEISLVRYYKSDQIELVEPLRELLMAELPARPLCSPECRGLCPDCGANLNREPCRCSAEQVTERESDRTPAWKKALKEIHPAE